MNLTPYSSLKWAYQLHYYLRFRTSRRNEVFLQRETWLEGMLEEICICHDFNLLEKEVSENELQCLLSLRPKHNIAKVIQIVKANSSREAGLIFDLSLPVWERGYWARSTGKVQIQRIRDYLEEQGRHHGYEPRIRPPVYKYKPTELTELSSAHSSFDLTHHLVFATSCRKGIFDSVVGEKLSSYWLTVSAKRGFAIDQLSVVPDHVHMIVRVVPKMSIEECALILLNNGQHFMGKNFPQYLIEAGVEQLWEPSAYAGTCGKFTTAAVKRILG